MLADELTHSHNTASVNGFLLLPAAGERLPRRLQSLDGKVTEIRLEQLLFVVAEFHVEITVECARLIFLGRLNQFIDALNTNTRQKDKINFDYAITDTHSYNRMHAHIILKQ